MRCKDCIHYEACLRKERIVIDGINRAAQYASEFTNNKIKVGCSKRESICEHFADNSRFIELPYVAGEYVYVIEQIFGESIEHTIRRRKIKSIEPHAEIKFYGGWIHDFLSGFGRYIRRCYNGAHGCGERRR